MSWYRATVPHDRIKRDAVVFLEDSDDVIERLRRGYLVPAEEPDWYTKLPKERKWATSSSRTTGPSASE